MPFTLPSSLSSAAATPSSLRMATASASHSPSIVGATGNFTAILPAGFTPEQITHFASAELKIAFSSDFAAAPLAPSSMLGRQEADVVVFEKLGMMAVQGGAMEQTSAALAEAGADPEKILLLPECYVHAIGAIATPSTDYLRGYQEGIDDLVRRISAPALIDSAPHPTSALPFAGGSTWGVDAVGATRSRHQGRGIKVAVLDTGFATQHPDFAGRSITTKIFTNESAIDDLQGHGTHCIGTAAGSIAPTGVERYGIAGAADIFALKVLNNGGSGQDNDILAAIDWAITNQCEVISMSLGKKRYVPGYDQRYERAAQRALAQGCLIVAAAGNDSSRPYNIAAVNDPACCPSIMAVAAVDPQFAVAPFSCGGLFGNGGEVDLCAPGVAVFSSFPAYLGKPHHKLSGTSMATPHVAGVAALWAESSNALRGRELWKALLASCIRTPGNSADVGAGLVQAPA